MGSLTYLFLILIWALPLILLQWLVGADILLRRWKVLLPGIFGPAVYLTLTDSVALRSTTWVINPTQSLNVFIPVIHVPVEEFIFLTATSALIVQGIILVWTPTIRQRIWRLIQGLRRFMRGGPKAVEPDSRE